MKWIFWTLLILVVAIVSFLFVDYRKTPTASLFYTTGTKIKEAVTPEKKVALPILMYHHIKPTYDPSSELDHALSVTPSDFEEQMVWLKNNGFHPTTFAALEDYFENDVSLPEKPVIITFDDGYKNFYSDAIKILERYAFPA